MSPASTHTGFASGIIAASFCVPASPPGGTTPTPHSCSADETSVKHGFVSRHCICACFGDMPQIYGHACAVCAGVAPHVVSFVLQRDAHSRASAASAGWVLFVPVHAAMHQHALHFFAA